jgi:hypothetical protein
MEDNPDYLIIQGDTLEIWEFPLESYFKNDSRPAYLFADATDKKFNLKSYIAHWEYRNDSLFLEKINVNSKEISLSRIFKNAQKKQEIFAFWYNASITAKKGKLIVGFLSEFEDIYSFKNGRLTGKETNHYSLFSESDYTSNQELLLNYIQHNINYSTLDEPYERAKVYVQIYSVSEYGVIDSVGIIRGWDSARDSEAIRVVKLIPNWTVIHKNGKHFDLTWTIPVKFGQNEK